MKALIAYSSIGHIALVLGGLMRCSEYGVTGAIVIVVAHGISSPAILTLAALIYEARLSRRLTVCKGISSISRVLSGFFPCVCR